MSAFLEIDGLSVGYSNKTVLQNLSLEVQPGELLGVIGPNGCGKSTLIKTLSGLLKPKSGQIKMQSQDLFKLKPGERARKIAVVAQNSTLPPAFNVAEVVMLGRTPHLGAFEQEGPGDWQIVQRAMEAADCWHLAARSVSELSGGERQRVLLALALAQEPRLLLLDEPTTFLDINYQIEVMDLVANWLRAEPERGVVAVLHDLNLAAQYCDRLALLSRGHILALGTPQEVINATNIQVAYGASVIVAPHPVNQLPTTFILPGSEARHSD